MAEFLVLGAGMVGISTALALQARGHEVCVLDRQAPGQETSFGNAGVIQAEAVMPYAMPRAPTQLLKYAMGRSNDLVYAPLALPKLAPGLLAYYHHSAPTRHAALTQLYAQMIQRATKDHAPLIAQSGSEDLVARGGIGEIYQSQAALEAHHAEAAQTAARFGLKMSTLSGAELLAAEGGLNADAAEPVAGAIVWHDSWSIRDPGALVAAYAKLFEHRGGEILRTAVGSVVQEGAGWVVQGDGAQHTAEQVVMALGPWSPKLLAPLGYRVAMVPKRGYHGHFEMQQQLTRPYLFADHGIVASSMARGLRLTTGAHLTHETAGADWRQLKRGLAALRGLLAIGEAVPDATWQGTRPCLPDMLPMVGGLPRHKGLWVNFGHGHQGITLGPTTGALLADAVEGQQGPLLNALGRLA